MSPAVKYTLGRFGLFLLVLVLLLPLPLNILVKAMIALVVSAILSYFLMADWRNQMAEHLAAAAGRRAAEKQRLRAALAGDETAAAAGDRATAADDGENTAQTATDAAGRPDAAVDGKAATADAAGDAAVPGPEQDEDASPGEPAAQTTADKK